MVIFESKLRIKKIKKEVVEKRREGGGGEISP